MKKYLKICNFFVLWIYLDLYLYLKYFIMDKKEYLKLTEIKIHNKNSKKLLKKQINNFYDAAENYRKRKHKYSVWDLVKLKKWTLLHWTWKNIEWLEFISKNWLISWQFTWWRDGKYLYAVWVRNLKKDILLKDYINFYHIFLLVKEWKTMIFKAESNSI